jgi:CDP-glycerol glycerophosphotransferase
MPPLISIIVPVHGVRSYLAECLDSLLGPVGQPRAPVTLEVIAVDDASPDGSGAMLDERAGADPRLAVIHLERNAGPGNARNVGLSRATGEYVWFADGDDLIAPGALAAVASACEHDHPDVLLIGYDDLLPDGSTRPGAGEAVLRQAPAGTFTIASDPQVITLSMTAWSKLFRRAFLTGLNEPFRPGIHEDIPVTCAALLAGRLSALSQACYLYRQARRGSFMATTSADHLAVFTAYGQVQEMLRRLIDARDPAATPQVQRAIFDRMISHYASVLQEGGAGLLGSPGRVPRHERRRFFKRMHDDFVGYQPAGYSPPGGFRGVRFQLIRRDAYLAYELLEPLNRLRVAVRDGIR